MMTDPFADLQEDWPPQSTSVEAPKYPCSVCLGSGKYSGVRVHQEKDHCFACRGKGYFTKSPADREKAKLRRQARKARMKAEDDADRAKAIEEFAQNHPEMFRELNDARVHRHLVEYSGFVDSLSLQLFEKGTLSDKQIAAWHLGREKKEEARKAREAAAVEVDLAPIREMFDTAVGNGYKKPKYRAEGLVLSRAPDTGSNPGAIYVKSEDGVYLGKIIETRFMPSRDGKESGSVLLEIAKDPLEAALRYGQRTGRCACCGRELTKHTSIDAGIGPICKDKWGL